MGEGVSDGIGTQGEAADGLRLPAFALQQFQPEDTDQPLPGPLMVVKRQSM